MLQGTFCACRPPSSLCHRNTPMLAISRTMSSQRIIRSSVVRIEFVVADVAKNVPHAGRRVCFVIRIPRRSRSHTRCPSQRIVRSSVVRRDFDVTDVARNFLRVGSRVCFVIKIPRRSRSHARCPRNVLLKCSVVRREFDVTDIARNLLRA
jgi:hypothetical protein